MLPLGQMGEGSEPHPICLAKAAFLGHRVALGLWAARPALVICFQKQTCRSVPTVGLRPQLGGTMGQELASSTAIKLRLLVLSFRRSK